MFKCTKMEVFTLLSVIVVYFGELNINCEAKALDKPVTEGGMAFTDFNRLQINSLAYPDEDYPTTITPAEDTTSASVENIGDLTSTVFYPPEEDDDIMNTISKEKDSIGKKISDDDDDDDEAERVVEDQQRVLIIFTQSTTAVLITFISCFILICVLFCCVFLCIAMGKPPRPSNMSIAVPPTNNNLPVSKISSYSNSSTNFDKKLDYKF